MYDLLAIFMNGGEDHLARAMVQINQINGTRAVYGLFCYYFLLDWLHLLFSFLLKGKITHYKRLIFCDYF